MWTSLRTLGILSIALLLGTGIAQGGELTNVTVGRFQDFTVVTLFGNGPMSVTHQIVEAKDGKPHRIVVDITGAQHKLPQNNYADLPGGSLTAIRTSQFAVSPEPVVRVVLDLTQQAAYRLESPEGEVRLLISLPNDPPMASTWSAREGALPATGETEPVMAETQSAPAAVSTTETAPESQSLAAQDPAAGVAPAEPPAESNAVQSTSESTAAPAEAASQNAEGGSAVESPEEQKAPADVQPTPGSEQPTAAPALEGEQKALPLAPAGALAVTGAAADHDSNATAPSEEPASAESTSSEAAATPAADASADQTAQPSEAEAQAPSEPTTIAHESGSPESKATEIPLPEASKSQPDRVIDYNLPLPEALAATSEAAAEEPGAESTASQTAEPESESSEEPPAPRMAVKPAPEGEAGTSSTDSPVTGTDAGATDVGSEPLASLSTLPPIVESADALVPERAQIIYHTHGKRDPFKPLLTAGGYSASALPDVSTLRLVGVLQDVQESWGLFEDANGYGYILRKGDRVKNGTLTQMTTNRAYFSLSEFGWSRSVHIDLEPEG